MNEVTYQTNVIPAQEELVSLYDAVGWSAYTNQPLLLNAAVTASLAVVTAYKHGKLIGLARLVGDGMTIAYLQDILIHPSHQHQGIGRELFTQAFAPYANIRQKVLITDDEPMQRAFYESMGFTEASELRSPIRTFVQLG